MASGSQIRPNRAPAHPTMAFLTLEIEPVVAQSGTLKGFLLRPDGDADREYAVTESSPCLWACCQRMVEEFDTMDVPTEEAENALHTAFHRLIAAPRLSGDSLPAGPEDIQALTDDLFDTFGDTLPNAHAGRATTAFASTGEGGAGAVAPGGAPDFDTITAPDFSEAVKVVLDDVPEPLPCEDYHKRLAKRMDRLGYSRDERLVILSKLLRRTVTTTKELSEAECKQVHTALTNQGDEIEDLLEGEGGETLHWNSLQGRTAGPLS